MVIQSKFPISAKPAVGAPPPRQESQEGPGDGFSFDGPRLGFEPWIGPGKPGHPPSQPTEPVQEPTPAICPMPPMVGIEPWLSGEPTDDPSVSPKFQDKLTRAFGDQALLSIKDERIAGCAGYYFEGWESVGGDDFIKGVTLGQLGDKWEMTEYGTYELKSGNAGQRLTFDMMNRQTRLESYYDEQVFDTTRFSEILKLDADGTMRREQPPVGL